MGAASTAAAAGTIAANVVMSGAMSQVWGMINGAQIFIHFPIFNIEFPSISQVFVDNMVTVATFDIFDPTWLFGERYS